MVVREPIVTPDSIHPFWVDPPENERAVIFVTDSEGSLKKLTPFFRTSEIFGVDNARLVMSCSHHHDPIGKEISKLSLPDLLVTPRIPGIIAVNSTLAIVDDITRMFQGYHNPMYQSGKSALEKITDFLRCLRIPDEARRILPPV